MWPIDDNSADSTNTPDSASTPNPPKVEAKPESVRSSSNMKSASQSAIKVPNSALYHNQSLSNKVNGRINKQLYQNPPEIQPKPTLCYPNSNDEFSPDSRFKKSPDSQKNNFKQNSNDETQSINGINHNDDFSLPSNPPQFENRNFDEVSVTSSSNSFDYNGMANRVENHGRTNSLITINGYPAYTKEAKLRGSCFGSTYNQQNNRTPTASTESINNGRFRGIGVKVSKHSSSEHLVNGSCSHLSRSSRKAVSQNYLNKDMVSENSKNSSNEMILKSDQYQTYSVQGKNLNSTFSRRTPSYQTTLGNGSNANGNGFYNGNNNRNNQDYNPLNDRNPGYLCYSADSRHHKSEISLPTQDYDSRGNIRSRNQPNQYRYSTEHQNESTIGINEKSGPSFRRIQNLNSTNNGPGPASRRFPSDTHLHMNETKQIYTSGTKPGPVTIPARSRSAQPSPAHSPRGSPTRFTSSRNDLNDTDDEYQILPSVREIIRQVEAMTNQQENSVLSSRSLVKSAYIGKRDVTASTISSAAKSKNGQPVSNGIKYPIERYNSLSGSPRGHKSQITVNRSFGSVDSPIKPCPPTNGLMNGCTVSSSCIRQNGNHNGSFASSNGGPAPPIPPHAPIILNSSQNKLDSPVKTRPDVKGMNNNNLPTDYHKLREAFIEQRKEIQRLRKEITDKDAEISQLRNDIRLYEPWH